MRLSELLRDLAPAGLTVVGPDPAIAGMSFDSRAVVPGFLFVAVAGARADGSSFIADALARGAVAVLLAADAPAPPVGAGVAMVRCADPRGLAARLAARLSGEPPARIAAVTGTSGKSSVVHFTRQIWERCGLEGASVGTLGIVSRAYTTPPGLTTPDPVVLHRDLAALKRSGVDHVALEASSHGLDQRRLDGLLVDAAAFTNLTHEHLDYHRLMDAYFAAKARLFTDLLRSGGTAIVNADSDRAAELVALCARRGVTVWTYGRAGEALRLLTCEPHATGQRLGVSVFGQRVDFDLPLIGDFQVSNALAALGLALATGADRERALAAIAHLEGAPGRLQLAARHRCGAPVYVDYAHKPQALEAVLLTLRPFAAGRLVVVFGCGGDRDRAKRPVMGEIATRLADITIVTDDNPRSEQPAAIRSEIAGGIPRERTNWRDEPAGRRAAIAAGLASLSGPADLLLIAGKGHESGQTIGAVTHPFDDAAVARELVAEAA